MKCMLKIPTQQIKIIFKGKVLGLLANKDDKKNLKKANRKYILVI